MAKLQNKPIEARSAGKAVVRHPAFHARAVGLASIHSFPNSIRDSTSVDRDSNSSDTTHQEVRYKRAKPLPRLPRFDRRESSELPAPRSRSLETLAIARTARTLSLRVGLGSLAGD